MSYLSSAVRAGPALSAWQCHKHPVDVTKPGGNLHAPDSAGSEITFLLSITALAPQKLPSKCILWECGCQEWNSWRLPTALCEDQMSSCLCCRAKLAAPAHSEHWALTCSAFLLEQNGRVGFLSHMCATLLLPWMAFYKIDNDVSLLQRVSKLN